MYNLSQNNLGLCEEIVSLVRMLLGEIVVAPKPRQTFQKRLMARVTSLKGW
jgi:hypothetical protein